MENKDLEQEIASLRKKIKSLKRSNYVLTAYLILSLIIMIYNNYLA
jgi:cell division septum initiation protein DivIVA